jgi:hypothetical protein
MKSLNLSYLEVGGGCVSRLTRKNVTTYLAVQPALAAAAEEEESD